MDSVGWGFLILHSILSLFLDVEAKENLTAL